MAKAVTPVPEGFHTVTPHLVIKGAAAAIDFYKRAFGAALWCAPRDYPGLTAKLACMGADYPAVRSAIEARYPFYKSTAAERAALFGARDPAPDGRSPPARVLQLTSSGAEASSPA